MRRRAATRDRCTESLETRQPGSSRRFADMLSLVRRSPGKDALEKLTRTRRIDSGRDQ